MRHIIVGTAGHIDHGKTALIRALTGKNTDRLEEEKRRGITIDLGFAYLDLPGGGRAGIIDVPGHERFIHNMAAGAAGMDLVLLVIAADEGVMPQTREHLHILRMLGVKKYVVVLNKCDLAEEEWLSMVEEDIRQELGKDLPENSPIFRVSARTGAGIEALKEEIARCAAGEEEEIRETGFPRIPVDRVFSVPGFGTVVTGTLLGGRIRRGDELEICPGGTVCRVRGIQVYEEEVDECSGGHRAALNLAGAEREQIRRGDVLTLPGGIPAGRTVSARLTVLEDSGREIKNRTRLHFYSGTSEVLCRAVPLEQETLGPGESGYVQLLMEADTALCPGDHFVVRFYSPVETIGGGVVLETDTRRERRFRREVLDRLNRIEQADPKERALMLLRKYGKRMIRLSDFRRKMQMTVGTGEKEADRLIEELCGQGTVKIFAGNGTAYLWHAEDESRAFASIKNALEEYFAQFPYRSGMPRAELMGKSLEGVEKAAADAYLDQLIRERVLIRQDGLIAPAGYEPGETPQLHEVRRRFEDAAKECGPRFVQLSDVDWGTVEIREVREIISLLEHRGEAVMLSEGIYTSAQIFSEILEKIEHILDEAGKITISRVRDLLGAGRKSAKLLLEYTDRIGITKKDGAESERTDGRDSPGGGRQ